MSNKNIAPSDPATPAVPVSEDFKDQNNKHNLSKFEYDLYHEEDDKTEKIVRVKRVSMPNKGEKWKIMIDAKVIFTIESTKISRKEKDFLSTVEGFNFMLTQGKAGIKSLNGLRNELKKLMDAKVAASKPKRGRPRKK